jgi:hypothetical protein
MPVSGNKIYHLVNDNTRNNPLYAIEDFLFTYFQHLPSWTNPIPLQDTRRLFHSLLVNIRNQIDETTIEEEGNT